MWMKVVSGARMSGKDIIVHHPPIKYVIIQKYNLINKHASKVPCHPQLFLKVVLDDQYSPSFTVRTVSSRLVRFLASYIMSNQCSVLMLIKGFISGEVTLFALNNNRL